MPRQSLPLEVSKFTGGLITDASPLTSPNGFMIEGENSVLNIDGSINRRLGMDFENNFSNVTTSISSITDIATATFRWNNAGGDAEQSILVVQIGNELKFFDLSAIPLSSGFLYTYKNSSWASNIAFSYAVVDSILVVSSGAKNPLTFTFTAPSSITVSSITLKIRDLFGVEDIVNGQDLYDSNNLSIRPTASYQQHFYNLRNQSWGIARVNGNGPSGSGPWGSTNPGSTTPFPSDPITAFFQFSNNTVFPSNSDTVTQSLYADPGNSSNRIIRRFFAPDVYANPIGSFKAAQGYFIIDALERGASRSSNYVANQSLYGLDWNISNQIADATPGGPSVICEYAGRMWYAGFSGDVIQGDKLSPRMSSYLLFSQLVENLNSVSACYQDGDPTSPDNPDIVDTDGGFIRINEAYGICHMVNLSDSLFVLAANGVWRVSGGTTKGFTATSYVVDKVSDRGCNLPDSLAVVNNTLMYWSDDGIYLIQVNEIGDWEAKNISYSRIQNLIDGISPANRASVKGSYDNFERKVRWLYQNSIDDVNETLELVFDTQLSAFYLNRIKQIVGSIYPKPVNIYTGNPYQLLVEPEEVFVSSNQVFVSTNNVEVGVETIVDQKKRELGYIVITGTSPITYAFAKYSDTHWADWYSLDNVGVDASAYTITNYMTQDYASATYQPKSDFQRVKNVPYLTVYLNKTEEDSSCIVQSMWEWFNTNNSGRLGRPFEAYREGRPNIGGGNLVVLSKNKLRGHGRVLGLKFSTSPGKDMQLIGFGMILSENDNV